MEEKDLFRALKRGEKDAFGVIFNKYAPDIFFFSMDLLKDEDEAEEILQETFIKVWENRKNIDPDRNFRAYLISIAKHQIYNMLKHKVVERKYLLKGKDSTSADIENKLYEDDLRDILFKSFDRLTEHQKRILTLKSNGLNNEEIAGLLNISKRTVEGHLSQAYKQLRLDLSHLKDILHVAIVLIICQL